MRSTPEAQRRGYAPSLGRFNQPDSIVPGAGDPRAWDRFAYVKNNPVVYSDPSGHRPCENEFEGGQCNTPKGWNRHVEEKESGSLLQSTKIAPKYFWRADPTSTPTPQTELNSGPTSSEPEIAPGQGNNHPDAYLMGLGGSLTLPPYNTINFGIELVALQNNHVGIDRSGLFVYTGGGAAFGAGANVAIYGGVVNKLETINDYSGLSGTRNVTISILEKGITLSQFGNPYDSKSPSGITFGWAPGAHISAGGSSNYYWRIQGW